MNPSIYLSVFKIKPSLNVFLWESMIQNYPERPRKKLLITIPLGCFFCPQNNLSEQDHKINVDTIDGEDTR
jgi:hypothetical protein